MVHRSLLYSLGAKVKNKSKKEGTLLLLRHLWEHLGVNCPENTLLGEHPQTAPHSFLNPHCSYNPDAAEWLLMTGCFSSPSSAPSLVDLYQLPSKTLWSVGSGWNGNGVTCWRLNGTMAWKFKPSNGFRSCSEVYGQCQTFDDSIMPHLSSFALGQKLLETSHSSKPIIEIWPRRTGTVFSKGADNLTSWLPAFIFSVFARDKLSCRIGNFSYLTACSLMSCVVR